ncbi:hypothetical protein [Nonomuraea sediminis]|uniref:hypothetical protein n=1 Tax=Nonomuraea sediminis TaxID=2835864 RepID=UPI001BDBF9C3|nr:hypothetical protein [Nonomuraea sediminis]
MTARTRLPAGLALALALVAGVAWWLWPASATPAVRRPVVAAGQLPARVGVRLVRLSVSGAGGLLDLRFQVTDPAKAASVHDPATPPVIIDEASGLVVSKLYMNHAHSGDLKAAITYYLVFENSGNWVHSGSRVTVLLGDAQVEHVVVV